MISSWKLTLSWHKVKFMECYGCAMKVIADKVQKTNPYAGRGHVAIRLPESDTLEYFGTISQLDECHIHPWFKLLDQLHFSVSIKLWRKVAISSRAVLHDTVAWRFTRQGSGRATSISGAAILKQHQTAHTC